MNLRFPNLNITFNKYSLINGNGGEGDMVLGHMLMLSSSYKSYGQCF